MIENRFVLSVTIIRYKFQFQHLQNKYFGNALLIFELPT